MENLNYEVLEQLPEAVAVYRSVEPRDLLYVNGRMLRIFECATREEFVELTGGSSRSIVSHEDFGKVDRIMRDARQTNSDKVVKMVYRIRTKSGSLRSVESYIRRDDKITMITCTDDDYTFVADDEKLLRFRHFISDGESNGLHYTDPDYKAFMVWNLTKNLPFLKEGGFDYVTDELKDTYNYDRHCEFLISLLGNDENSMKAKRYNRERLLELHRQGQKIEPLELTYKLPSAWVNVHSDFYMMEDPATGDVYLKLQNHNFVDTDAYARLFESNVREVFDSVLLIDVESDTLLVADSRAGGGSKTQQNLHDSIDLVCDKMGLPAMDKNALVDLLEIRCEDIEQSKWTYETEDHRFFQVRISPAFLGGSIYSVGITDVTKQILDALEREAREYRNKTMLAALAQEYVSVIEVNIPDRRVNPFKVYERTNALMLEALRSQDYDQVQSRMTEYCVARENQQQFSELTDLDYIKARLQTIPNYNMIYKSENDRYVELKVVRADESMEGEPVHVLLGFADRDMVTREKISTQEDLVEALNQARAASQAKTRFLANMSHDIRTPMNAIIGYTSMAQLYEGDQDKISDFLRKISVASEQLLNLINDILDMSKIESGKLEFHEEPTSLIAEGDNLKSIFAKAAERKRIDYRVETDGLEHGIVLCDRKSVDRILMNIVSNAIKFTDVGGKVLLKVEETQRQADQAGVYRFTIQDNGIGMSPEFLSKIYEPFERERTSTLSHQQGTGLGMAIVRNLVRGLHGTIQIDSTTGKGTTIVVELPLKISQNPLEELTSAHTSRSVSLQGKHVLVVDDMPINREIARMILEEQKIIVDEAADGIEAVTRFEENPDLYDCILMDVTMPMMDGYEATRRIRDLDLPEAKKIPILAMTANAFAEDRADALKAGMNDHITKPIDVQKLYKTLTRYMI